MVTDDFTSRTDNQFLFLIISQGDFEAGKYRCLICNKEFNSESGVKYHINSVHSQVGQAAPHMTFC